MLCRSIVIAIAAAFGVITACHETKTYPANVEITRMSAVRKDEHGVPITLDLELSYIDCPGAQMEVLRGGRDFAACVSKYKVGDKVPLSIEHRWGAEGHYVWDVKTVGDCGLVRDPEDEAAFAMVRECSDWKVNDQRVGFECKYVPEKALIAKCPWFQRR